MTKHLKNRLEKAILLYILSTGDREGVSEILSSIDDPKKQLKRVNDRIRSFNKYHNS